ncbi:MAG: response regulator [Planctomycetota bacterium]
MACRVLFVDDDQMLLSSMERCLGLKFDLETALSGPEALRKIEDGPPFHVIVTDMRMPVMDGIQFIQRARELSKHSVYLMLTGNQDVETAVRAVNDGQVTRFLNKPTDPADIAAAIEMGARQHELESNERELLNKTFVGAVGILADVMETLQPDLLGRAGRAEQFLEAIRARTGATPQWEYKIAAKLSLVGYAMLPGEVSGPPQSARALARLAEACTTTARMVDRIPRMTQVSQIIRMVPTTDGDVPVLTPRGEGDVAQIGATLLRIAMLVESLSHNGVDPEQAEKDIRDALPNVHEPLLAAAMEVYPSQGSDSDGVPVAIADLLPGMVLHHNLVRTDGATLLRAGRRLSETHLEKLLAEDAADGGLPPVVVTRASFTEAYPDAAVTA